MADKRGVLYQGGTANTPSILTPSSGDTVLVANSNRGALNIQNLGTHALFVRLGDGATTSLFHIILKAASGADDGTGGTYTMEEGTVYTGSISVAGTSPRLTILEI